ncbi:MAG: translocation/assembly module TamB domain-containing protein, partial [Janthinobacterium lividum]
TLSPQLGANIVFALGDSMYDGLPMTGHGTVHWLGTRLLPSQAALSVAGNDVKLDGSFGAPRDRLRFDINAQRLDRLGFGLAGTLLANGNVSGSLAHPDVAAHYRAENLAFGDNRVAAASGELELRDGVMGVTHLVADASGVSAPGLALDTLSARVDGTRSNHSINLAARGTLRERPIDVSLAARGALAQTGNALSWNGTVSQLANRGVPQLQLDSPLTVSAGPQHLVLGATQLSVEGATLVLSRFAFDHGRIASAGAATNIDVQRMLNVEKALTGERPALVTDLVIDGKWDFDLSGGPATGYLQLQRRSGDVTVDAGNGPLPLGISQLLARAELTGGNRADLTVNAKATRLGSLDADLHTPLTRRDGFPALADEAPLSGHISADLPSLRIAGGLLGPAYLLDGRMALRLTVAGQLARPKASGMLTGDNIAATLVDEGVQFKHGVVRVAVTENRLDFQQVEFHGGDGVLRATGRVQLDGSDPDLSAKIVADKFELFATPDRQLSLSGQANVGSAGPQGGMTIGGKFTVDRALFDLPNSAAPQLGDDVVLVRSGGAEVAAEPLPVTSASEKPEGRFAPRTNITIDLGQHFRFRGQGADLGLTGSLAVTSAPREPLRAVGDVRVTPGSTYEAFGRKLGIESGYFTFNGPVDNPGINITAMRRNLEVEAGVRVSGTVKAPDARLISEPNVPDQDKLSWLLFGHGSDTGTNTAQQGTLNAAIGLLGNAGGKRLAQTFGLDEVTVGQSEVGLSDPQVVSVAKAVSERFVLGYEQGLTKAESVFKLTWQISRSWSIAAHGGAANGVDLLFNRRFD